MAAIVAHHLADNGDGCFTYTTPDGAKYKWDKMFLSAREVRMLGNGDMLTASNLAQDYVSRCDLISNAYKTGRQDALNNWQTPDAPVASDPPVGDDA